MQNRMLGMIFEKPSTRTRISLETAMEQMGGNAIYLNPNDMQIGRGETIEDTGRVLSGFLDVISYRAFRPLILPKISFIVMKSASICTGCSLSSSAFITGILALFARDATLSCLKAL